jgi:hypothetical protein
MVFLLVSRQLTRTEAWVMVLYDTASHGPNNATTIRYHALASSGAVRFQKNEDHVKLCGKQQLLKNRTRAIGSNPFKTASSKRRGDENSHSDRCLWLYRGPW